MNVPLTTGILGDLLPDAETGAAVGWLSRGDPACARALDAFAEVIARAAWRLETRPSARVEHALHAAIARWIATRRLLVTAYRDAAEVEP